MAHAHIIGIAGVGMGATALLLKEAGWTVSGSDEGAYPPMSTSLSAQGINIQTPYRIENIPPHVDLFIVGKNAKLTRENPEVSAAYASGITVKDFAVVIGEMIQHRMPVVVTGSSGKSTTTALLAWCLHTHLPQSGYFVGAIVRDLPTPARLGTDPLFAIEGDEYPTGHDDSRSKFMHYHAHDVIVTSLSHDHVNIFPTPQSYEERFQELVSTLPSTGIAVLCSDDVRMASLIPYVSSTVVTYGTGPEALWRAHDITYGETTTFTVTGGGQAYHLETALLGEHNIRNITAVCALLMSKKSITPEAFTTAVRTFTGVRRRLDRVTTSSRVPLYEGFGSSREKAQAAIRALKTHFPGRRLVVLFEPHTFSWRNAQTIHWYDDAFVGADILLVYHPGTHGQQTHEQLSHEAIISYLHNHGVAALPVRTPEEIIATLTETIVAGDLVLMLTSGNFEGAGDTLPAWFDTHYT